MSDYGQERPDFDIARKEELYYAERQAKASISGSAGMPPPPRPSPINVLLSDLQEFTDRVRGLGYRVESTADRLEGPVPEVASNLTSINREPTTLQDWSLELRASLCRLERQVDRLG